jgi:hypothetical protein
MIQATSAQDLARKQIGAAFAADCPLSNGSTPTRSSTATRTLG